MAIDKPKSPKRKKLKGNHPLKARSAISRNKSKKFNRKNANFVPLGKNKFIDDIKEKGKDKEEVRTTKKEIVNSKVETVLLSSLPAAQQLDFFLDRFQSANKSKLSPLELEAYRDTCMVELSKDANQDAENINKHIKDAFGESWKEVLCDGNLFEGTIEPGSPAVLIISVSALSSLELLRGLKVYTKNCRPAKLFAKHMKVEEQIELLRSRVNIASGTPSRIKKLIDMDALMLSRLAIIVLDIRRDVKGYSLLTLPQVSAEFWNLYRAHLNERIIEGSTRICFYGLAELPNSKQK
ncbi:protein CMSS1 [Phalaenopsis equestris]|uniref:protein CMSS1 n=1 Tax=Phalaenopsis equestris TaxID=78828 RepID=UPI0009E2E432|nr:protein CMSS1 [Phalaenopsis equestris]